MITSYDKGVILRNYKSIINKTYNYDLLEQNQMETLMEHEYPF